MNEPSKTTEVGERFTRRELVVGALAEVLTPALFQRWLTHQSTDTDTVYGWVRRYVDEQLAPLGVTTQTFWLPIGAAGQEREGIELRDRYGYSYIVSMPRWLVWNYWSIPQLRGGCTATAIIEHVKRDILCS